MKKPLLRAILTAAVVLGSVLATGAPAQAYPAGSLRIHWAEQDAYNCKKLSGDSGWANYYGIGPLNVGINCYASTRWQENYTSSGAPWTIPADSGGRNLIVDVTDDQNYSDMTVVLFQAYGEHLKVIDPTKNDQDTIYVWIGALGPFCGCASTNNYDLNLVEDGVYQLKITDDKAGTHVLASSLNGTVPAIHA